MRLGILHVERDILQGLTAKEFRGWEMFHELDPISEARQDYRIASIVQMLYNVNRGKNQKPGKLEEFVLKFEADEKVGATKQQTAQQQFNILKVLAAMHANDESPVPTVVEEKPHVELPTAITFASPEDEARWKAKVH